MQAQIPAVTARRAAPAVIALVALVALVGGGCSNNKITSQLIPNQPPEVRLTGAPLQADPLRPDFYAYTMRWSGYDPDGRVDHFLVAVDPADPSTYDRSDTSWRATAKNESTFFFSAGTPITPINPRDPKAEDPHTISVFAVDNEGMLSKRPAVRSFYSFTQCPYVQITEPVPNSAFTPNVTPTVTIKWTGQDPDGQFTTKPVRWVFRLFGVKNPDFPAISDYISYVLVSPDSLRRHYAPNANYPTAGFRGWNTVGTETTLFQYRNLNPGSSYLFAVTGFDEAGAYDPVFANGKNLLQFGVTFAGQSGPIITMFNQFFFYQYPSGGYNPSEQRWFRLEIPADQPLTFNWFATPPQGADIRRYRWVMDLVDLSDESPRSNEATDWYHWSAWSRNTTSATIGPFTVNNEKHLFYIEAEDNNGLKSLGIIEFTVVKANWDEAGPLLFVDDTRLPVDLRSSPTPGGPVDGPKGPWPTAAELDTFLFARGGFPWRHYPAGTLSPPGIFNGYEFDTVGTRGISLDGAVPLSFLVQFRHIVWYTDEIGANYTSPPSDRNTPITALRLVSRPGRPVILSTYITQGYLTLGGKVWLAGGGAAAATLYDWNARGTSTIEFTSSEGELVPGRFMYDFAHWREGVQLLPSVQVRRFGTTSFGVGTNRPGRHWPPADLLSRYPSPTPSSPPNYALLPARLQPRNPTTDPVPPLRQADAFYRGTFSAEYIHRPTFIREDYDDNPDILREFSTLDTLYITEAGSSAPANRPIMTYYHGRDCQPIVFSGFNFWYWRRDQCIELVDWVLQQVWGMQRDPGAPRTPSAPASARRAAP